ncbi:MAG: 30S ribosomal protein S20 [Candidatus Levybacteria bacterium]|nr:30S ribosomal protein S20 [Candidatus Levybacteria bacterium]
MPVIKSAKKKLRQDKKRQAENKTIRELLRKVIKEARKNASEKKLREVFSVVDKAAKKNIIHKNKAARIKSSFSKKVTSKTPRIKAPKKASIKKRKTVKK